MKIGLVVLGLLGAACQKEDPATKEKLDKLLTKVEAIEKKVDQIQAAPAGRGQVAGAPGQAPQRPNQPDPAATYSVPIDGDPISGNPAAAVTIVKAVEFACPFCRRVGPTVEQLQKEYGDKVRLVFKHYVVHPQTATAPALATCAAQQQGKFFEYEKALWEAAWDLDPPKLKNPAAIQEPALVELAGKMGLDVNKFKADLAGDKCKNHIAKDQKELAAVGARGTPAFFINGRFLSGAQPIERFKAIIDEELKKQEAAVKQGAKAETYYQELVVAKGKKSVQ